MATSSEIADLLDVTTKDLMHDVPLSWREWLTTRGQRRTCVTYASFNVSIDSREIEMNKSSASKFLMLLKSRFFNPIEDAYLRMVERWGMPPRYVIEEPKCEDYYGGFVA